MANEILTEIVLELRDLNKQLKGVEKKALTTGNKAGRNIAKPIEQRSSAAIDGIKRRLLGLGAAFATAFAGRAIIRAAGVQEKAVAAVNQSLRQTGEFTVEASKGIQEYAASLQKTTGIGDELILQNFALAQSFTKNAEQAKELTAVAIDFAAAADLNYTEAVRRLGRATQGSAADVSNFDSRIRSLTKAQLKAGDATRLLGETFAGAAAAQLKTFDGAVVNAENSFGDLLESIGRFITQNPVAIQALNQFAGVFSNLAERLNKIEISSFNSQLGKLQDVLIGTLATGEFVVNIFNTIAAAVGGLAAVTVLAINREFAAAREAAFLLTEDIEDNLFDFNVTAKVEEMISRLQVAMKTGTEGLKQTARESGQAIIDGILGGIGGGGEIVDGLNQIFATSEEGATNLAASLKGKVKNAVIGFASGVGNAFATIGAALVKGEDAFAAFGNAVLGVFGELAIQIGSFFFLQGLGNLLSNPAAAAAQIAAGTGLIILGGALKAISGGSGGSAAPAAAAAGGGASLTPNLGGGDSAFSEQPDTESEQRVVINVQGSILDRRETGLELAEVISEAFGTNGVRILQV